MGRLGPPFAVPEGGTNQNPCPCPCLDTPRATVCSDARAHAHDVFDPRRRPPCAKARALAADENVERGSGRLVHGRCYVGRQGEFLHEICHRVCMSALRFRLGDLRSCSAERRRLESSSHHGKIDIDDSPRIPGHKEHFGIRAHFNGKVLCQHGKNSVPVGKNHLWAEVMPGRRVLQPPGVLPNRG